MATPFRIKAISNPLRAATPATTATNVGQNAISIAAAPATTATLLQTDPRLAGGEARSRRETVAATLSKRSFLKYALAFEEGPEHVAVTIGTRDGRFTEMTIPLATWKREDFLRLVDEYGGEVH